MVERAGLSRERIVAAAVALADAEGSASFSMRRLAERLGVEAMSLYHHFPGRDAILDGMVDDVFAEIRFAVDADWRAAMRARALSARDVFSRHPWAVGLLESRTNPGPASLRHLESVLRCLRQGGFSLALAGHAFAVLDSYIYGFVLQEQNLPFQGDDGVGEVAGQLMEQVPADEFPYLTELAVEQVMKPGYAFGNEFEFGLNLILDGLERKRLH